MVLTPDADKKVKWTIAYCWAKETSPIFRDPDWQNKLFPQTGIINYRSRSTIEKVRSWNTSGSYEVYSLSGKKLNARYRENKANARLPYGLVFVRDPNGLLAKKIYTGSK